MGQAASSMFPTVAQQEQQHPDEIPWTLRYGSRSLGTIGGLICIALGVFTCVSLSPGCIVGGIFQMIAGFLVIVIEAPCCCLFIDRVQHFSQWFDTKPYWQKGVFYLILSLPPLFLCFGLSTIFGCGFIFLTAVLYGTMSLGKKASREEMLQRAGSSQMTLVETKGNLPTNSTLPTNTTLPP